MKPLNAIVVEAIDDYVARLAESPSPDQRDVIEGWRMVQNQVAVGLTNHNIVQGILVQLLIEAAGCGLSIRITGPQDRVQQHLNILRAIQESLDEDHNLSDALARWLDDFPR